MNEYVIVGDTERYEGCLVCVCWTEDNAKRTLERMLSNPTDSDKQNMAGFKNLRTAEITEQSCWWNDD